MVFLPRGPPPPAAPAAFIQGLVFPGTLERPVKPVKGQNNRGATVGVDRRGRPAGYRRWRSTSLAPWRAIRASTFRPPSPSATVTPRRLAPAPRAPAKATG